MVGGCGGGHGAWLCLCRVSLGSQEGKLVSLALEGVWGLPGMQWSCLGLRGSSWGPRPVGG